MANGVVILIPEPITTFKVGAALNAELKGKLKSVLPEDDRCVTITDPLEVVLDRVMEGKLDDRQVTYTINRLVALSAADVDAGSADNLMSRSFGSFLAEKKKKQDVYLKKVEELWDFAKEAVESDPQAVVVLMASQSGLPLDLLEKLRLRLSDDLGSLPTTVEGWIGWVFTWLKEDADACEHLLRDVEKSAVAAVGKKVDSPLTAAVLEALQPGIEAWISGKPVSEIQRALGGNPDGKPESSKMCLRARELIATFIPRGLSFVIGVVARMAEELDAASSQPRLELELLQSLSGAVRRGFDTVGKLQFANGRREIVGRVQLHRLYEETYSFTDEEFDEEL